MDRYDEAMERARAGMPIDEVFPELKESEDERIRKRLIEYIGASAQNLIKNGCYPAGVSCNCGVNVYGGYDYSYASCDGRCYSRAFRKVFNPVDFDILQEKNN